VNALYPLVAERAVYRCEYCHAPEIIFNFPFEVEHILPQARGGSDDLNNLALACHACNLFKSDFETGQDEERQAEAALFHPRSDVWEQHFGVDVERAASFGITPVGRATLARLQMNRPRQITARRRWIQLGLFP
jgi:HNH endonuclease